MSHGSPRGSGARDFFSSARWRFFRWRAPGAAAAVTLASYESFADSGLSVTGVRTVDGETVGTDAVLSDANYFGGENYQELFVRDADGNEISPAGMADVGISGGSLFDAGYRRLHVLHPIRLRERSSRSRTSRTDPLFAALRLSRQRLGRGVQHGEHRDIQRRRREPRAGGLYFEDAGGGFFDAEDRLSPEAVEA